MAQRVEKCTNSAGKARESEVATNRYVDGESIGCLTIDEVSKFSRLCRSHVYKLIRANKLKARKIGNSTRVLKSDFDAFLRALPSLGSVK